MSRSHAGALFCREWTVQKAGLESEQNEDACLIKSFEREDGSLLLVIAVADGATEAVYSRLWARKLVEAAGPDWPLLSDDDLSKQLVQTGKEFSPFGAGGDVPWFVRNKYKTQGSQAALLVVRVVRSESADSFHVRAVSAGDCCLIVFKASGEVLSFPVHSSAEFGVNPVLLGNLIPQPSKYDRWEGQVEPGDMILVATDAVSLWALQAIERGQRGLLFESLLGLLGQDTSEPDRTAETSSPADLSLDAAEAKADGNSPDDLKGVEKPHGLWGWLRRLRLWSNQGGPRDTTESPEDRRPEPEVTAEESGDGDKGMASQNAEPTPEEAASDSRPKFEQFIERYRAPESELLMRNDDSTLVVCISVRNAGEGQEREAIQVIRHLQTAVAQQPNPARLTDEADSD